MGSNFGNNMDAWNRHTNPGAYAVADAIKERDAKDEEILALRAEVERLERELAVRDRALENLCEGHGMDRHIEDARAEMAELTWDDEPGDPEAP